MPFIRKRGNQLCLVHGVRNPESKQVEQKILFTFYSKAEVREAFGVPGAEGSHLFASLIEDEYSDIRFDWKRLKKQTQQQLDALPDIYPCQAERIKNGIRQGMTDLLRELAVADPQWLASSRKVLLENQIELAHLQELISRRLQEVAEGTEGDPLGADNYFWRYSLRGKSMPPELEEELQEKFEAGDLDEAARLFGFYTEAFPNYAEGHNYLGIIALRRRNLELAREHFLRTIQVGRTLFPKRIAKSQYWSDHATRPYMRGLRNLVLTLIRLGDLEEALDTCDRLKVECGDQFTSQAFQAAIHLNQGKWRKAYDMAAPLTRITPSEAFIAAFAAYEQGQHALAMLHFVHGMMNYPYTAALLTQSRPPRKPVSLREVGDYSHGVETLEMLAAFQKKRSSESRSFFRQVFELKEIRTLLKKLLELERRHEGGASEGGASRYSELMALKDEARLRDLISPIFEKHFG